MFIKKGFLLAILGIIIIGVAGFLIQSSSLNEANKTLAITAQNLKASQDTIHILQDGNKKAYKQLAFVSSNLEDTVKHFNKQLAKDAKEIISLNKTIVELRQESNGHGEVTQNDSIAFYNNYDISKFIHYYLHVEINKKTNQGRHSLMQWIPPFDVYTTVYIDKDNNISSAVQFPDTAFKVKKLYTQVNGKFIPPPSSPTPLYPSFWSRLGVYGNTNFDALEGGVVIRPLTIGYDTQSRVHVGVNTTFYELYKEIF